MKKSLVFTALFGIFMAVPVLAANNHLCNRGNVDLRTKSADADEFLYETKPDYNNRVGYECDRLVSGSTDYKNSKCGGDEIKIVKAGHVWGGAELNYGAVYDCQTNISKSDHWEAIFVCPENNNVVVDGSKYSCQGIVGKKCSQEDLDFTMATDGVYGKYTEGGLIWCLATKCKENKILFMGSCYDKCEKPNATEAILDVDECKALKCEDGYRVIGGDCVKTASDDNDKKQSDNVKATAKKVGDACSAADLQGRNAAAGKYINIGKGKVSCQATQCLSGAYMVYKDNATQGWCVYPSKCPDGYTLNIIDGTKTDGKCNKVGGTSDEFVIITHDAPIGPELPDWDLELGATASSMSDEDIDRFAEYTGNAQAFILEKRITDAAKSFNDATTGMKQSKWRNKDGKFNTARLASDGVAGVVLGTTAGLITAHVVKKGQIKNGYEDIKCTIGGQEISDWGDELTVGVR